MRSPASSTAIILRHRWIGRAGVLGALLVASAGVGAQDRFQLVTRDVVAAVPGLEIVRLRDSALSACYTLFIVRSPAAALVAPLVEPTSSMPPRPNAIAG
jgi:hypothetical protein